MAKGMDLHLYSFYRDAMTKYHNWVAQIIEMYLVTVLKDRHLISRC